MIQARGTLVRWMEEKGFGFIRPDDGSKDVFVHIRDFGNISRTPKVGDIIRYQPAHDGTGKFRAADVHIEGLLRLPTERVRRARAKPPEKETAIRYRDFAIVVIFSCAIVGLVTLGKLLIVIPFIYLIASCITMLVYAFDKSAAMGNRWRIPENALHLLGLAGGWPGALIAQSLFRHKSKKTAFRVVFWTTVAMNCGLLFWSSTGQGRAAIRALVG